MRIGLSLYESKGPVDLLGEDEPRHVMRKRHIRERHDKIRPLRYGVVEAEGAAGYKVYLGPAVEPLYKIRKAL